MATTRTANAHWEGNLFDGKGRVSLDSSGLGSYDVSPSRSGEVQSVRTRELGWPRPAWRPRLRVHRPSTPAAAYTVPSTPPAA